MLVQMTVHHHAVAGLVGRGQQFFWGYMMKNLEVKPMLKHARSQGRPGKSKHVAV